MIDAPVIVGGGPAGIAAALALQRGGARPLLIERTRETGDAICGGFLSWRTLDQLERLGIGREALGTASINRLRLIDGPRSAEAALPHGAIGVSRRHLDSVMMAAAIGAGVAVERGVTVRSIETASDEVESRAAQLGNETRAMAWRVRLADGTMLSAESLFLASGKHDVRGAARPDDARGKDPSIGLRMRTRPSPAQHRLLAGMIELHLFDRGYCGINLQEDGSANICMAVRRSLLAEAGTPAALFDRLGQENPHLGERLAGHEGTSIDAIANIPYGWRQTTGQPGLFRLGDQAGVIPSLAGEGIGIALATAARASAAWQAGRALAAPAFQAGTGRAMALPIGLATMLRDGAETSRLRALALPLARTMPMLVASAARATRIGMPP